MADALALPDAITPRRGDRIRVVDDRFEALPRFCPDCDGPLERSRLNYRRAENERDAGVRIDTEVPRCAGCRLTLVPSGLVAAVRLAAGWHDREGEDRGGAG